MWNHLTVQIEDYNWTELLMLDRNTWNHVTLQTKDIIK